MAGVYQHRANSIGSIAQCLVEQTVIAASIGGQKSDDVFQGDNRRLFRHFVEHTKPFPEKATPGSPKSFLFAGK